MSPVLTFVVPVDGGVLSDGVFGAGVSVGSSGAGVFVISGVGVGVSTSGWFTTLKTCTLPEACTYTPFTTAVCPARVIWKDTGYGSVLYMSVLAGIDTALYEAHKYLKVPPSSEPVAAPSGTVSPASG